MTLTLLRLLAPIVAWGLRRLVNSLRLKDPAYRATVAAVAGLVGPAALALERACRDADPDYSAGASDFPGLAAAVRQEYGVDLESEQP